MINFENIITLLLAYIVGSIPSSVWIGKAFHGVDVRKHGSGNAGATNTYRVLGAKTAFVVLAIDIFKGWFALQLAYFIGNTEMLSQNQFINFQLFLAVAVLVGHLFPVFASFKGGKGIATLVGIIIALFPYAILVCVGIFVTIFIITRYVSLGSIISAVSFPFIVIFIFKTDTLSLMIFSSLIAVFVPVTHKKNIKRLIKGEELKLDIKRKQNKPPQNADDEEDCKLI